MTTHLVTAGRDSYVSAIIEVACNYYGVTKEQFHNVPVVNKAGKTYDRGRHKGVSSDTSSARHLFVYLMKVCFFPRGVTYTTIAGYVYPGYHHTNVVDGINKIHDCLWTGEVTHLILSELQDQIKAKLEFNIANQQNFLHHGKSTQTGEKIYSSQNFR